MTPDKDERDEERQSWSRQERHPGWIGRQDLQDRQDLGSEPSLRADAAAHAVIGAAIEVHYHLGPGFLESIYEQALALELRLRGVPFRRQVPLGVQYKGECIGEGRVDFLVDECLIVELKAVDVLAALHRAQLISYLKVGGYELGLLINFNERRVRDGIRRVVWST
jgi:GxxExxY protein